MQEPNSTRVLLVEDSPPDAQFVRAALKGDQWDLRVVGTLADALGALAHATADVVLLDLGLPDARRFEGVDALRDKHSDMPLVILSGNQEEAIAIEALQRGAQDYLVKGSWSRQLLHRVIRYSIERQRLILTTQRLHMLDASTGLPNRSYFDEALHRAALLAKRNRSDVGLVYIDVDRVTAVNDQWGHKAGDLLLEEIARRLGGRVRGSDLLARLSGDEFALLLDGVRDPAALRQVGEAFHDCATGTMQLGSQTVDVTVSVGVALLSETAGVNELRSAANQAMRLAKDEGGGRVRAFSAAGEREYRERLRLEVGLRGAEERGELRLMFQPLFGLTPNKLLGFEALLRWQFEGRAIPPCDFIPIAENTGLIDSIGSFVLREAARFSASLLPASYEICVNLSTLEFANKDLAAELVTVARATGADPTQFTFEVTESVFADPNSRAGEQLNALRQMGCRVAIDDFGTGYSALSQLQQLPLDVLKLDKSFVTRSVQDRDAGRLAKGIIALGQGLQLQVIAEGIETEEELKFVVDSGCDIGQGYLLGRPLDEAVAVGLVQDCEVRGAQLRAGR